jgi:hypothetical protein
MAKTRPASSRTNPTALGSSWWKGLSDAERRELAADRRRHPIGVLVRFVEPGEAPGEGADHADFYEYLINHEVFLEDGRTFHICSAHPDARACIMRGHIPGDFSCPRDDAACPMRALLDLAPGQDAKLGLPPADAPVGFSDE